MFTLGGSGEGLGMRWGEEERELAEEEFRSDFFKNRDTWEIQNESAWQN